LYRGASGVSILYRILFVLMALRLLMPPGICACKLSSPAARLLADFFQTGRPLQPVPPPDAEDDDHNPGCPASPLAVAMGLKPASHPILPPDLAPEPSPALEEAEPVLVPDSPAAELACGPAQGPLYLTLCALLI
jgi:hypothetical protein